MTDDVRKLLGGYATGTLSSEEQKLLFDAALHDDELFAALADEQALKELLDDSGVRAQLLRATEDPRFSVAGAFRDWFDRPKAKALVATAAVLLTIIGVNTIRESDQPEKHVAEVRTAPPAQPLPAPSTSETRTQAEPLRRRAPAARTSSKPEAEQSTANSVVAQAPPPPPPAARGVVGGVPGSESPTFEKVNPFRLSDEARPAAAAAPKTPRFERVAGAGINPLRYELLRKEADGEFRPVAADHEFAAGDVIRVRVTSMRDGAVALTAPGVPVASGQAAANTPTILPAADGITITDSTIRLVLSFAPPSAGSAQPTQGFTAGAAARSKEAEAPGLTVQIPIRHRR